MKNLSKLLEVQKKVGAISKDATNPYFKSKYFDINKLIAVLKPILNDANLVVLQPLSHVDGVPAISTVIVDGESGETLIESLTVLPKQDDPQKMGGIITYFRRYALQSLFFLEAEDDDGNHASGNTNVAQDAPPAPKVKDGAKGDCLKCGAPMRLSKAGKPYCSKLCWKNAAPVEQSGEYDYTNDIPF